MNFETVLAGLPDAVVAVDDALRVVFWNGAAEVRRGETLAAAGRMAVGLAHEIRNPLGAIRGAVQLLARELGGEARFREYTDVLIKEVDRVIRIIQMLLDLARPVQLRIAPLNLHQLLERVALLSVEGAERSEEHTLNSSHGYISYAVFCLKKKKKYAT